MRKFILAPLILFICLSAYPESIKLKSDKVIEAQILAKGDKYIKVDLNGEPLFYYLKTIRSIDGQDPSEYLEKESILSLKELDSSYFQRALEYASEGKFAEAKELLTKSSKINIAVESSRQALEIIEDLDKGIINKKYARLIFKGMQAQIKSEPQEAINFFKKAARVNSKYTEAYHALGGVYISLGQFQEAVKYFKRILEITPKDVDVCYNLGVSFSLLGDHQESIEYFKKAIEIDPGYVDAYNDLGVVYAGLGEHQESINCFEQVLKIEPANTDICYNLGVTHGIIDELDQAAVYFQKVIQLDPNYAEAYAAFGLVNMRLDENSQAKGNLERARELFETRGDTDSAQKIGGYLSQLP